MSTQSRRYSYTRVPCQQAAQEFEPITVSPLLLLIEMEFSLRLVSRREVASRLPPAQFSITSSSRRDRYNNAEKGYEDRSSDSIEVQSQCMPEVRDERSILLSSCSHLVRTFRSILTARMVLVFLVGGEAPIVPMTYTIVLLHAQISFTNILFLSNVQYHH